MYNISGTILAGGPGSRLNGRAKAKIIIDGATIISRITDTIKDLFNEIIIVTNTPGEFKEYSDHKIVGDQFLNAGPLGGIHAALKASSNDTIFVFAGDMPLLDRRLIIKQIDYYYTDSCDILIPRIGNYIEPLHSVCSISVLRPLEEYLSGSNGYAVREFIKMLKVRYLQLEESEENQNAFTNVNSPADISAVEKLLGNYLSHPIL